MATKAKLAKPAKSRQPSTQIKSRLCPASARGAKHWRHG